MPWWARIFPPCYPLYWPLLYFTIRPRNRKKRTFWCHGSHRASMPHPDSIFFVLAILTTLGSSGGPSCRLLGPFYPIYMHILQGEGPEMQVSDNLPPSPYMCIDTQPLTPTSHNFTPYSWIHSYIYLHTTQWLWSMYKLSTWSSLSSLCHFSPFLPLSTTCSIIPCHVLSYIHHYIALYM
jgi:hypothetical protein